MYLIMTIVKIDKSQLKPISSVIQKVTNFPFLFFKNFREFRSIQIIFGKEHFGFMGISSDHERFVFCLKIIHQNGLLDFVLFKDNSFWYDFIVIHQLLFPRLFQSVSVRNFQDILFLKCGMFLYCQTISNIFSLPKSRKVYTGSAGGFYFFSLPIL